MIHTGTKTLRTPRLTLRPFARADRDSMLRNWLADPAVQHEYGEPTYETPAQADALLDKWLSGYTRPDFYRWAVIERESGECIGQIAFCRVWEDCAAAEIEYCIGRAFQGRGYAPEALNAVIGFALSRGGFDRLEAYHRQENTASGHVLQKSAMRRADTVERFRREGTSPQGKVCYRIDRN